MPGATEEEEEAVADPGYLTVPDELALISRTPDGGKYGNSLPWLAVTGGELAELAFHNRVAIGPKRATVIDPSCTGEPTLDDALAMLIHFGGDVKLHRWLSARRPAYRRRLDHLCQRGFAAHYNHKVLFFDNHKYVPHAALVQSVLTRLWHVLCGWQPLDPRTASLAALVYGSDLGSGLFKGKQERKALRYIGSRDMLGVATRKIVDSSRAGAMVAATGAGAAGGGGGGGG